FGELVLREGFGGEEVEGAGVGSFEDFVEGGEVVAEGLAGGGGRDDDDVLGGVGEFGGGGLVGVGLADALGVVGGDEVGIGPSGEFGELGFAGWVVADGGEDFAERVALGEVVEDLVDASEGSGGALGGRRRPSRVDGDGSGADGERVGHGRPPGDS